MGGFVVLRFLLGQLMLGCRSFGFGLAPYRLQKGCERVPPKPADLVRCGQKDCERVTFGNVVPEISEILTTGRAHRFDTWRLSWSWLGQRPETLWTKGTLLMITNPSTATLKLACRPRSPLPAITRLVVRPSLIPVRRSAVCDFFPAVIQFPRTLLRHNHLANQTKHCRCSVGKMFD